MLLIHLQLFKQLLVTFEVNLYIFDNLEPENSHLILALLSDTITKAGKLKAHSNFFSKAFKPACEVIKESIGILMGKLLVNSIKKCNSSEKSDREDSFYSCVLLLSLGG